MNTLLKILTFLMVNTLGFHAVPFCYLLGVRFGLINLTNPNFDEHAFQAHFVHGGYMTWLVCALFSVAFFFFRGKERYFFLLAPLIIPFCYGLSVILAGFFAA
jgi:hypothetical protein